MKNELDEIHDQIAEDIRIRSKCDWYEHGEKFFLNLKKQRGSQNTIKKLIIVKEIAEQRHILENTSENFTKLFKTREQKTKIEMRNFFSDVDIPKLSENQVKICEESLTEK